MQARYKIIKKHITEDSLSSEVNKRLKECGWYVTDAESAEWSEDIIRKAVKEVGLTQHQIDWFKTNVFPPKPEWSEEDEDMLNSCISSIEEAKENRYAYKETDGDTSYDHEIAWLKSLRNRVGKESLQPHWKPSEEKPEVDFEKEWDEFEDWMESYITSDYPTYYAPKDIARHFYELGSQSKPEVFDTVAFQRGVQEGRRLEREDVKSTIQSRIDEILGDAQPYPILRMELNELIKKIES